MERNSSGNSGVGKGYIDHFILEGYFSFLFKNFVYKRRLFW